MSEHQRSAPETQHVWIKIHRDGHLVHIYCDACKVTPQEWLMLQPVKNLAILQPASASRLEGR